MKNYIKNILLDAFPFLTLRKGQPTHDLIVETSAAINETLMSEMESVREKLSIANYQTMTPDELDLLASNYLQFERNVDGKARGILRIYMNQKTDLVFSRDRNYFKTVNNVYFRPSYDFAISNIELKYDDTLKLYYVDILIESIISMADDTIIETGKINTYVGENPFVEKIANIAPLVVSTTMESNYDVYSRLTEWGVLSNPTRKNYLGALILNTFPDVRRLILSGANNRLMKRDLTFNYLNALSKIQEFNFFNKKSNSSINNANYIFKGLLESVDIPNLGSNPLGFTGLELSQEEYEAVAFRDGGSVECSTLLSDIFFPGITGYSSLIEEGISMSETGAPWDTGSSKVTFSGDVNLGLEVRGSYVENDELIENEKGVVLYKDVGDPRNKEFALEFVIKDFVYETTTTQQETNRSDNGSITQSITISNNKPLYFTVLKKGKKDSELNILSSSYDGYGVIIMKKFIDQRPNVFLVDGSSGVGDIAFEDEILQRGSERILAGKYIPLEMNVNYTCIMQINENYGMNVFFKDQYNSEMGSISIGGGGIQGTYQTIYDAKDNDVIKTTSDIIPSLYEPKKFKFISLPDEDIQCSGILNLKFLLSFSNSNKIQFKSGSKRILTITSGGTNPLENFKNISAGDILKISNKKYLIKRKIDNYTLEVTEDATLSVGGNPWEIWKDLEFNNDFIIPQTSSFNNFTILSNGVKKITDIWGGSISNVKLFISYIEKRGIVKEDILLNWTGIDFKSFDVAGQENMKLKDVCLFNIENLTLNEDFFFTTEPTYKKINSIYLTQEGFNKIGSKFFKINMSQGTEETPQYLKREYILEKSSFIKGYEVPINYGPNIKNITYLNKCYTSEREFKKGTQYFVTEGEITNITVNPSDIALFYEKNISFETEVIGTGEFENIFISGSSTGNNIVYTDTPLNALFLESGYYTLIFKGERYFITEIALVDETPFLLKNYKITLDKNIGLFDSESCEIRKKYITNIVNSKTKFGYKYDIKVNKTDTEELYVWNTDIMTYNIKYGENNLIFGQDYESDRKTPIEKVYISKGIYDSLTETSEILFRFEKRIFKEEILKNKEYEFFPISSGSYLGIGFKNVNNGHWNLLALRIRQLLERYSGFHVKLNVGKDVKNEDRLFLEINSYALSLNSTDTNNGVKVFIFNKLTRTWELLYENDSISNDAGFKYLQFKENTDEKFKFGYYIGSMFYTVNENFYPTNYVDNSGYLDVLITSRGKTDSDFSGNIIVSEVKLNLDYINLKWQKDVGVHTGNKMDIWIASDSVTKIDTKIVSLDKTVNELELDETILKPILNVISFKNSIGLDIPFQMVSVDENLRFSTKEKIKLVFAFEITSGDYYMSYEYMPHILNKQLYIDSLNRETDVLVKNLAPAFVKLNLSYSGNIDETVVKNSIRRYVRFNNYLDLNFIETILKNNGATYISYFDTVPIQIYEYDTLLDPVNLELYSSYSLKEEKYFDIKISDINLIKM